MKVTGSSVEQIEKDRRPAHCRRWRLWVTTDQGRKSKRFRGTYTQAHEELKRFVDELASTVPNPEKLISYARSWAEWRAKSGDYSPNMVAKDARSVRACRKALLWLKEHPEKGEGELSAGTIAGFHSTLKCIFAQAVGDGLIASNPMANVKYPKVSKSDRKALSPSEISELLDKLDAMHVDGRIVAIYLMACLGLRRGEACALLDADVAGGFAHVSGSVKDNVGKIGPTKSAAGVRTLPIPPRLDAKIAEWRDFRSYAGLDGPTLACNTRGGLLLPQNLYKWWAGPDGKSGKREEMGYPGLTMHELRHSNLSMMARFMSPFDLQRYAGWSSIGPAKIYVHDDLDKVSSAVARAWDAM